MSGYGPPNTVLFGYLEGVDRKDAEAYARGFARRTLATAERVWYQTESIYTGFLYEIHDGGGGRSFLPELITALETEPAGTVLVPSGRRVFELSVRNGRPTGALLSEERSLKIQRHLAQVMPAEKTGGRPYGVMIPATVPVGHVRFHAVRATKRMKRLASTASPAQLIGIGVLLSGLSLLGVGASSYMYSLRQAAVPRGTEFDRLPHRQWASVVSAAAGAAYVTKLEFKDGQWTGGDRRRKADRWRRWRTGKGCAMTAGSRHRCSSLAATLVLAAVAGPVCAEESNPFVPPSQREADRDALIQQRVDKAVGDIEGRIVQSLVSSLEGKGAAGAKAAPLADALRKLAAPAPVAAPPAPAGAPFQPPLDRVGGAFPAVPPLPGMAAARESPVPPGSVFIGCLDRKAFFQDQTGSPFLVDPAFFPSSSAGPGGCAR